MADAICVGKFLVSDKRLILELRDAAGDIVTAYGNVDIDLSDLTGTNKRAAFREIVYQNADCSAWKKRWVLCTEEEDADAPA